MIENKLIRTADPSFKPKHLIIVGNGALEGGWEVVQETIMNHSPFDIDPNSHNAFFKKYSNYMLASIAFIVRNIRENLFEWLYFNKALPPELLNLKNEESLLIRVCSFLSDLHNAFDEALKTNKIKLRKHFQDLLENINDIENVGFITTNWDELLWQWKDSSIKNLIHLHGKVGGVGDESWLLLPTEICMDENTKISLINAGKPLNDLITERMIQDKISFTKIQLDAVKMIINILFDRVYLKDAHYRSIDWINESEEITFYGINLNLYDAELNTLLLGRRKEKVTVVNPDSEALYRVAALFMKHPDKINHICPSM